jgi:hypothetical protein
MPSECKNQYVVRLYALWNQWRQNECSTLTEQKLGTHEDTRTLYNRQEIASHLCEPLPQTVVAAKFIEPSSGIAWGFHIVTSRLRPCGSFKPVVSVTKDPCGGSIDICVHSMTVHLRLDFSFSNNGTDFTSWFMPFHSIWSWMLDLPALPYVGPHP